MADETSPQSPTKIMEVPTTFIGLAKLMLQMFGSQTFGAVLLFTVWLIIVDPILSRDTKDREEIRQILEESRAMRAEMTQLVHHLKLSAEMMDRMIVEKAK